LRISEGIDAGEAGEGQQREHRHSRGNRLEWSWLGLGGPEGW
jgi:hypothetical protein